MPRTNGEAVYFSRLVSISLAIAIAVGAQTAGSAPQKKSSSPDETRTIRIGVALMENRSGRNASPVWERDQLLRELKGRRTKRKSSIIIDAVSLEASSKEDAAAEAAQKKCDYFVLTTMLDPHQGPGVSGGPDGIAPAPVILGNGRANQMLAINFAIVDTSDLRTFAQGTSTAPVEENNDIRAADDAVRMMANQIASELRKNPTPKID